MIYYITKTEHLFILKHSIKKLHSQPPSAVCMAILRT